MQLHVAGGHWYITRVLHFRIVKDPRFERLPCMHSGTYADDCIVNRVTQVRQDQGVVSFV